LKKDPSERLGTGGQVHSVKQQPFFKGIDWDALQKMKVTPPYKPPIVNVSNTDCALILTLRVKW
jgi:hypothetical protein